MPRSFIDRLLLPAIFGLTTMVAVLILWQLLIGHRNVEIQAATQEQASFIKTKTESELRARVLPLERLAGRWEAESHVDENDMESDAGLAMSGYPAYRAIKWLDPALRVRWAVPQRENQADIGTDLGSIPGLREAVEQAVPKHGTVIAPRVQLRRGGEGFIVCVPMRSEAIDGVLVGVFQYNELLSSILQDVAPDYWVAIYDGQENVYSRGAPEPPVDDRYVEQANIGYGQLAWRVVVWPKAGAVSYARSGLPLFVSIGGLLMALMLAFAVYMAETAQVNVKMLAAANRELEREIAGREQAEEALRHAQKMEAIGRLAGGVAHDFNNLLMVIRGQAALSQNNVGLSATVRRELSEIMKAADRASSLTRKLLALGRKQVLQSRVLDLNALVSQVAEILPSVLGEHIQLHVDLDPALGRVRADSAQLEQVIMNLVFNARDAMPLGGDLTIQTANSDLDTAWTNKHPGVEPGPYVMFAVRDTGHGMDEETQAHLFEPFFTTKDTNKGTGLGLATVYGTVNQSGGCVTVSSKVGQGTAFEVYLPRVEEQVEVVETAKPVVSSLHGEERILVVEDDDAVRRMTREFLKIKGYSVIEARSAADAILWMESHDETIDLVLTDVVMPGIKGGELVGHLAKLRANLKVLYMSAYTEGDAIRIGILSPGTAFIEKPFSPDELAAKVREVLNADPLGEQPLRHGAQA
ncbi:MAG TPA: ATP-binding protein [Candidatus Acidoferrales bacterium]|nr:ATP-binding protein [Candidatus Acidoferrales bacterium]